MDRSRLPHMGRDLAPRERLACGTVVQEQALEDHAPAFSHHEIPWTARFVQFLGRVGTGSMAQRGHGGLGAYIKRQHGASHAHQRAIDKVPSAYLTQRLLTL